MKVFGCSPYLSANLEVVPTPVGEPCLYCQEPILAPDIGFIVPHLDETGPRDAAQHRECMLRHLFGSVGHQMKKCSCYSGTEEDPPGMTPRQAASAAMDLAEVLSGRRG